MLASTFARNALLFDGLSEQDKEALLKQGRVQTYGSGRSLFMQGDPASFFYLICNGAIQLYRSTLDGHEVTIHILPAGSTIGQTAILQKLPYYPFSARTINETTVIIFSAIWLREAIKQHDAITFNILSLMANEAALAKLEVEHKSHMTAAQQVACYLARFCSTLGLDPHRFLLPYKKTLIASRLGIELETLSRAFGILRAHGLCVRGTEASVNDPKKFESFVCSNCSMNGFCSAFLWLNECDASEQAAQRTEIASNASPR